MRSLLVLCALIACGDALPRGSLTFDSQPTPIRQACALAEQRCTRCHTTGRILASTATTREEWAPIVTKMRQMSSSGITRAEADTILECLTYRSAGRPEPGRTATVRRPLD